MHIAYRGVGKGAVPVPTLDFRNLTLQNKCLNSNTCYVCKRIEKSKDDFSKKRIKRLKRVKDIIKHKGCQKLAQIKKMLKRHVFHRTFFNITNKSIIFISKSC